MKIKVSTCQDNRLNGEGCPFEYDNFECRAAGEFFDRDRDDEGWPTWCPLRKSGKVIVELEVPKDGQN